MRKILVISHLFPNNIEYSKGTFVFDQVNALSKFKEINVVSPIIWIPFSKYIKKLNKFNVIHNTKLLSGVEVYYPRYFAIPLRIPSRILMWVAGILYFISVFFETLIINNEFKFEIIHSHFAFPDGLSSVFLGKIFKKPVIITVHGSDINLYTDKMGHLKPMVIYSLKNATHIIAVSAALKNKITKLGIADNKISVVPNGYNPSLFRPMDKDAIRRKLKLPLNKKIVLFVGHLIFIKGVTYLIESMKFISELRDDTILIVVGDGHLKSQLNKTVEEYSLLDKVMFVGSQPHEKIPLWINSCDLLTLPSISEGFGAVLIEAAACGKPIVATNVGGIPEASSPIARKLIPPNDSVALAKAILEVLDSTFDPADIIKENKRFDLNNIADQLIKTYENIE